MNFRQISKLPQCLKLARVGDAERVLEGVQGVYSWNLPIPKAYNASDRLKRLPAILAKLGNAFSHEDNIEGNRYSLAVNRLKYDGAEPREPEEPGFDSLWLANHVIPFFSGPLYVGKCAGSNVGRGISQRIKEEKSQSSIGKNIIHAIRALDLSAAVNIDDFIIVAIDVKELIEIIGGDPTDYKLINKISEYIESSIFWAGFPPLNIRKGS